jgi:hypothetical protein
MGPEKALSFNRFWGSLEWERYPQRSGEVEICAVTRPIGMMF